MGAASSRKIVFTPCPGDREAIARALRQVRCASVSAFVRDAVREKLARLQHDELCGAVERYCDGGADDTDDLLVAQAVDEE